MPEGVRLEDAVEFTENPEPRCACVLLLDTSSSMTGQPIQALNDGLRTLQEELVKDRVASLRVEIAAVTFDSEVRVVQDFVTADRFTPPTLTAQGVTHMGCGIQKALDMVEARKKRYKDNGVAYYRPWVFMITDGEPQGEGADVVDAAVNRIRQDEANNRLAFFAVGVENANMQRLREIAVREPVKLIGLNFTDLFVWLSASMQRISSSRLDQQVALPPTGWGAV